ncbi:MAG: TIGR00725 family protein [Nitrospiraceae bacterium]|nr:TIGR00725 family protein [Nitrospiraceae bacterium]
MQRIAIAVIGGRKADKDLLKEAEKVGRLLAGRNAVLVSGGLGGVMEAVSRGMKSAGGLTVGILPQDRRKDANDYIDMAIATGLGIGRNVIIARTADAVIAVGGEYGTLSEIAFSLQLGKPVVGIRTWDIEGVVAAEDAGDAVDKVFAALAKSGDSIVEGPSPPAST